VSAPLVGLMRCLTSSWASAHSPLEQSCDSRARASVKQLTQRPGRLGATYPVNSDDPITLYVSSSRSVELTYSPGLRPWFHHVAGLSYVRQRTYTSQWPRHIPRQPSEQRLPQKSNERSSRESQTHVCFASSRRFAPITLPCEVLAEEYAPREARHELRDPMGESVSNVALRTERHAKQS
jgi:hypothetical protein